MCSCPNAEVCKYANRVNRKSLLVKTSSASFVAALRFELSSSLYALLPLRFRRFRRSIRIIYRPGKGRESTIRSRPVKSGFRACQPESHEASEISITASFTTFLCLNNSQTNMPHREPYRFVKISLCSARA
jgi:hypothetical protein